MFKKLFLFSVAAFMLSAQVWAQKIPTFDLFHGDGCPHCANERAWIESDLKVMYPDLKVNEYEVWFDAGNKVLWEARLKDFDMKPSGVPTNIIGDQVLVGFDPNAILAEMEKNFGAPAVKIEKKEESHAESGSWWNSMLETILGWFGA